MEIAQPLCYDKEQKQFCENMKEIRENSKKKFMENPQNEN